MVASIAAAFATGSAPGSPRHTGQVCVLGSAPKVVEHPQNILDAVPSSTWVSRPMTGSYRVRTSSNVASLSVLTGCGPPSGCGVRRGAAGDHGTGGGQQTQDEEDGEDGLAGDDPADDAREDRRTR